VGTLFRVTPHYPSGVRQQPAPTVTVRMRLHTKRLLRDCAALAWSADGRTTDAMLADALSLARRRYIRRCRARGIDPAQALAGIPRASVPMPDLRRPGPVVD